MISLARHRQEALRRLQSHQYEIGPEGLLIPKMGLLFHGHFEASASNEPWSVGDNIVVDEGILDLLGNYFAQGSQHAAFYIAPFTGNITPDATLTAATFTAGATEFTAYTQSTRVLWAKDAAASNAIGNDTTPATFTMATGGPYTIRGAALIGTASTKSAATGKLAAAARFVADKTGLVAGEDLRIKYILTGTST